METTISTQTELNELLKDNQINIYNVLNNRAHVKGIGHTAVKFTEEIKGIIFRLAVETIGGRNPLKVRRFLNNGRHLKHFALERLILTNYDNKIGLTYCAGQDYPAELQDLRKYIYKVV
jgi:hypothetical protein